MGALSSNQLNIATFVHQMGEMSELRTHTTYIVLHQSTSRSYWHNFFAATLLDDINAECGSVNIKGLVGCKMI